MIDSAEYALAFRSFIETLLSDHMDIRLAQRKAITSALTIAFNSIVKHAKPEVVFEIGAHEANFSSELKSDLPAAKFYAMEAHPQVWEKHRHRLSELGIIYINYCIGSANGYATIKVPLRGDRFDTHMGSILEDTWSSEYQTFEVPQIRLDTFAAEQGLSGKNVLWIDVEGALPAVVCGGPDVLSNCVALYTEVESKRRWRDQELDNQILPLLERAGLKPFLFDVQRDFQYNLICVRSAEFDTGLLQDIREKYFRQVSIIL